MNYKGYTSVELRKPKRARFDHSHDKRLTTRMGRLTPVLIKEVLPNDTVDLDIGAVLRLQPILAPIMHEVNVYIHVFYCPNRIVAKWWSAFITNGRLGTETPPVPSSVQIDSVLTAAGNYMDKSSLWDYYGGRPIPDADAALWGSRKIDVLPFAVYQKTWYDFYRDRNYTDDPSTAWMPLPAGDVGDYISDLMTIRTRLWAPDYFITAATDTQRGTEVLMPLEGTGTVTYNLASQVFREDGGLLSGGAGSTMEYEGGGTTSFIEDMNGNNMRLENIDEVQLTSSDVSINDFRRAIALQTWMERAQIAGSDYDQTIKAHFGRQTSDGRLQRVEYLGGGKVDLQISEIVTTAYSQDSEDNTVPPAAMSGHSKSFAKSSHIRYNCEEWGFIIAIMSIMPKASYKQGIPRMFIQRNTFLDYPWPAFAHLGEQEVYDYELYATPTTVPVDRTTNSIFGYQSRYADWKDTMSSSHGDFHDTLEFWALDRDFSSTPELGNTFVTFEDALQDKIFAVTGGDTCIVWVFNKLKITRSLPYFGTPASLS